MKKKELPDKLVDIDWHPTNPVIAICGSSGGTSIWVSKMTENWSTYAPKFEELQSNKEYIEREDEFDYKGEDESEENDDDDDDGEEEKEKEKEKEKGKGEAPPKKKAKKSKSESKGKKKKETRSEVSLKDRMGIDIVTLDLSSLSDDDDGYDDTPEEKKTFLKHLPIDLKPDVIAEFV